MGILKLQDWLVKHQYHRLSQSTKSSDCQYQGGTYIILFKTPEVSSLYGKCSQSDKGPNNILPGLPLLKSTGNTQSNLQI